MTYVTTLALCLLLFRNFGFFGVYTGFLCSYRLRESDPANGCHGPSYITQWFCVYSLYFLCVFFIIVVHASGQHGLSTMLVAARSSAHSTWLWDGICLAIGVVAFSLLSSLSEFDFWFFFCFIFAWLHCESGLKGPRAAPLMIVMIWPACLQRRDVR